jgi:glycosyltransferase involved in cell wall biosynthesis
MDISIIVPVYNAEKFLNKCLDSLFNQVFTGKFEVIAIDDASTDGSLAKLKEIQKSEPRLKILEHKVNQRQAVARVSGMNVAIGSYIMHVDADDWLLPGAFQRLHDIAIANNADIVLFNYEMVNVKGELSFPKIIVDEKKLTSDLVSIQKYFFGCSANKFVRRNLTQKMITGISTINTNGDDLLYCTEVLLRSNTIYLLPETYYVALINSGSLTQSISARKIFNNISALPDLLNSIIRDNHGSIKITNKINDYLFNYLVELSLPYWISVRSNDECDRFKVIDSLKISLEMTDEKINLLNKIYSNKTFAILFFCKKYGTIKALRIIGYYLLKVK